jgi:hypothetical protein
VCFAHAQAHSVHNYKQCVPCAHRVCVACTYECETRTNIVCACVHTAAQPMYTTRTSSVCSCTPRAQAIACAPRAHQACTTRTSNARHTYLECVLMHTYSASRASWLCHAHTQVHSVHKQCTSHVHRVCAACTHECATRTSTHRVG